MRPDQLAWATVTPRKHRHMWATSVEHDFQSHGPFEQCTMRCLSETRCLHCGNSKDFNASRRGRNNRSRGNAIEREVCRLLGISRVGQFGGAEDGGKAEEWIAVQVKSGGAYPERIDRLLRALPERMERIRGVVHADTPGLGGRRRMLITLDLREFAAWYGGRGEVE